MNLEDIEVYNREGSSVHLPFTSLVIASSAHRHNHILHTTILTAMAVVSRPRFAALASLLAAAVSADPSPMPNVQVTPWATNCSAFPNQLFAIVGYSPNNADVDNIATQEYDDGSGTIYVRFCYCTVLPGTC